MGAVMDRAVLIGQGHRLDVPAALGDPSPASEQRQNRTTVPRTEIEPLDDIVSRHIKAALQSTHGRIEGRHGAARLLRINPHTLRARMRKLKIAWREFRVAK
jgi:transcriptional regulator with GAF, ATPase, and Fis domain